MNTVAPSAVDAIGNTPVVSVDRFVRHIGVSGRIFAKLDYLNPGFSKKDRIARQIIAEAEKEGRLMPRQTVVELTSGNTGTGLAIVCACKGYPFVAVMSKGNSMERARMMRALGAEVVLVEQSPGSVPGQVSGDDLALVEQETCRIVSARGAFRADQFALRANLRAHYLSTAVELLDQTCGRFDAFCDFVGSGGTFGGCAKAFKEHDPRIRCYVVEPESAAVLAGHPPKSCGHRIQGGGYGYASLNNLPPELIDGYLQVSDREAVHAARSAALTEGIFSGISSGANLAAAAILLRDSMRGAAVVVVLSDSGLKYLSTDLWH